MSEQTGILDETGQAIRKDSRGVVEPLFQHMRDRPISTAFIILAIGFVLGKSSDLSTLFAPMKTAGK